MYCNVIVRVENNNYIAISSFRQLQLQCHNIYNILYIVAYSSISVIVTSLSSSNYNHAEAHWN